MALDRLDHAGDVDSTVHAIAAVPLAVETARAWQMLGRSDYFAQRYADAGSAWRSAREALEQGRPVRPDDPRWSEASAALHYELGDGYRMLTAFDGARNSYQQAFAAQPPDSPMQALQLAAVFAQAGDSADYRRLIQWMQESYGGGQPNDVVCTVIAACLLPETDSSNRDLVVRATQAYEAQKTGIRSAHLFAMGLAYLRCGDGAMALDAFSKVKEFTTFAEQPPHLLSLPYYRSLAYHATGDVNRAREELFRAEASYRRAVTGEVLFGNYPTVVHLRDRMRLQVDAVRYAIDVRIAQLARAEASALLDEQSRPDASKHLLAARGFALLGDAARAEAEFGLAEQAAGDDSEMWLACGRLRASLGDHQAADRSFQKAIELDPSNAMHWIHRGRWKAERGLHEQADADFTRGASLTPAELNKFLEAGWWVVGPYAGEPAAACPPEDNPDPSVPVPVMDLRAVRSDAPVAWRPISPDRSGRLYPFHDSQNERASVYLLTYVYSVDQRTVTLRTRRTSEMTIWLNGVSCPTIQVFRDETSVRETADPTALAAWALGHNLTFTPLTLKQGRNTILLKLTHTSPIAAFHFCLNDHPVERAFDLARAGLLDEASEVFAKGYFRESVHDWQYLLRTFFLGGRHHPETLRQAIDDSLTARTNFGMHLAMQTPVCPVDPDELIRYAQTKEFISGIPRWMFRRNVGLGYLRAARWEDAIAVIAKNRSADEFAPIVLAMAHHHLDQGDKARELLAESLVEFQAMLNVETDANPYYVSGNVSRFYTLLREAHVLIAGDAVAVDRQFEQFQSTRRTLWRNRDPATDVFDDLVHIAPDQPEAYIARGRRLVELQRNEEAEADFQRAKDLESAGDRSGL